MNKQEILDRIDALTKEAGISHNELAAHVYEARDKHLREQRRQHQEQFIMFYFDNGLMLHEVKGHTVPELVRRYPATLRDIIRDYERRDGKLGMMINDNIPASWATFPMSDPRFIRPAKY